MGKNTLGSEVHYPCLNCNKRQLGCHSYCVDYQRAKEKTAELVRLKQSKQDIIEVEKARSLKIRKRMNRT